jgi:hypothetical protein
MQNKLVGMIGAAVVATLGSTQIAAAAPDPQGMLQAKSFAELLQPIPNAEVVLAAAELASLADDASAGDREMMAQYRYHHHHHHHNQWRRHYRHHHHHHHHHHYRYY